MLNPTVKEYYKNRSTSGEVTGKRIGFPVLFDSRVALAPNSNRPNHQSGGQQHVVESSSEYQ